MEKSRELLQDRKTPAYAEKGEALLPGQTRIEVLNVLDAKQQPTTYRNMKSIFFEHHSVEDQRVYSGTFTMRRLPLGEIAKLETEKARVNAGVPPTEQVYYVNEQLIDLKYKIVNADAPEWFKSLLVPMDASNPDDPNKVYDADVTARLHAEVVAFELSFRRASP